MPTLDEIIAERKRKREAERQAMADTSIASDATRVDTQTVTGPTIKAQEPQAKKSFGQEVVGSNVDAFLGLLKGVVNQPTIGQTISPTTVPQYAGLAKQTVESVPRMIRSVSDLFRSTNRLDPDYDYLAAERTAKGGAVNAAAIIPMITGATSALKSRMAPTPKPIVDPQPTQIPTTGLQTTKRTTYRPDAMTDPLQVAPGVSPRVAAALRTTAAGRTKSKIVNAASRIVEGAREAFEYEHTIKKFPELQDDLLVHKATLPERATSGAIKTVVDVISGLDRQSYLQFNDVINLRDLKMTAMKQIAEGRPVKLQNGVTLDEVNSALRVIEPTLSDAAKAALDKHGALVTQIGQDLVGRGVIPKKSVSPDYFPHQVLGYLGDVGDYVASGGRARLKVPYREYAQKRMGSELPVETDYRRAMLKYLTAYAVDNATVDFLGKQVRKYDISPSLAVDVPIKTTAPAVPGQSVASRRVPRSAIPEGYTEYVPESAFKVRRPDMQSIKNPTPLEQAMMDEMSKIDGSEYIRPDAAVIPTEIAERFMNFGEDVPPSLVRAVNKAHGLWKGWTIGAGGVKFTVFQLTGDALNLFREDARAFGSVGKAAKQQITRGPLYQQAKNRAVVGSGFVGREVPDIIASSKELSAVGSTGERLANAVLSYNPFKFYRDFQIERENFLRLTKFVADMNRGVEPSKAAKSAREFTVDYNKFTPQENKYVRGFIAPFYAFAKQNTKNWVEYSAKHPAELSAKFIAPYFAASLWNEEKFPEVDNKIPSWMRDQLYVILDANDSTATVLTFATPLDDAVRKFGLAHPRKLIEQFLNTQIPGIESDTTLPTGVAALREIPGEAVKEWANLLTPAIKLPIETVANYSIFSGKPIEKSGERTLPDSMKTQTIGEYALGSLFRPYREVTMFQDAAEKGTITSRFLPIYEVDLKSPFSGKEFVPQDEVFNQMLRAYESGNDEELSRLFLRHGSTISPRRLQDYLRLYQIQRAKAEQR